MERASYFILKKVKLLATASLPYAVSKQSHVTKYKQKTSQELIPQHTLKPETSAKDINCKTHYLLYSDS